MKLEKLICELEKAIQDGVPADSEIVNIDTLKIGYSIEAVNIYTGKETHTYKISANWQKEQIP